MLLHNITFGTCFCSNTSLRNSQKIKNVDRGVRNFGMVS